MDSTQISTAIAPPLASAAPPAAGQAAPSLALETQEGIAAPQCVVLDGGELNSWIAEHQRCKHLQSQQ